MFFFFVVVVEVKCNAVQLTTRDSLKMKNRYLIRLMSEKVAAF